VSAYRFDQYGTVDDPAIYIRAGETIAFNLNNAGHPFAIRVSNGGANYNTGLTHVATDGTVSTGSDAQGKVSGKLYWKVPYELLGNTYVYQCTVHAGMVGNIVIEPPGTVVYAQANAAYGQANAAYSQANTARTTANDAYGQANTARTTANDAYGQANTARTQANTAYGQANNARNQANSAYGAANNIADGSTAITLRAAKDFIVACTTTTTANTVDLSNSNYFRHVLTGSTAFTFANAPASGTGQLISMLVIQDEVGGRTPSWTNTVYWAGGTIPPATTAANARDLWTFITYDGGTTFWGTLNMKDVR
jgi:plastocyanin